MNTQIENETKDAKEWKDALLHEISEIANPRFDRIVSNLRAGGNEEVHDSFENIKDDIAKAVRRFKDENQNVPKSLEVYRTMVSCSRGNEVMRVILSYKNDTSDEPVVINIDIKCGPQ